MHTKEAREFLFKVFLVSVAIFLLFLITKDYIGLTMYDNNFLKVSFENETVIEYQLPYEVFIENLIFTPNIEVVYLDNDNNGLIDHFQVKKDYNFKLKINFKEDELINITFKLNVSDKELVEKYNLQSKDDLITIEITNDEIEEILKNAEKVSLDQEFHINLQDAVPLQNINDTHYNNITGSNETVCILDTGVYNHSDIINRVIEQKCFCDFCCPDGSSVSNDASDGNGHGTIVAGIVGASGNITGTAPNVSYLIVKVCSNSGSCSASNVMAGINYCASKNVSVITMSLGSSNVFTDQTSCNNYHSLFTDAINKAYSKGIFIDASSGNSYSDTGISYPACLENITSVGAVDKSNNIASYSNRGVLLDLFAVGTSVNSTTCKGVGELCHSSGYIAESGTSFSAPFVAGSAAVIKSYMKEHNVYLNTNEIRLLLKNTGKIISENGNNYSRINLLAAIQNISVPEESVPYLNIWNNLQGSIAYNNVTFYANTSYENCTIQIDNETYNMTKNNYYEFTKAFTDYNIYDYIISCGNESRNSTILKEEFNFYLNKSMKIFLDNYENKSIEGANLLIKEFDNNSYSLIVNDEDIISMSKFLVVAGEYMNKTPHNIIINYSNITFEKTINLENDILNDTENNHFYFNVTISDPPVETPAPSGGSSSSGPSSSTKKKTEPAPVIEKEETPVSNEEFEIHEEPKETERVLEQKEDINKDSTSYLLAPIFIGSLIILTIIITLRKSLTKKFINQRKLLKKKR